MEVGGNEEEVKFAFDQYMKCSPPRDNVDQVLGCISLRGSTDDDRGHRFAEWS